MKIIQTKTAIETKKKTFQVQYLKYKWNICRMHILKSHIIETICNTILIRTG